jgi:hypothetical protein
VIFSCLAEASPADREDHCLVVYTFGRSGARKLFRSFSSVEVRSEYLFTYGFGPLTRRCRSVSGACSARARMR